MPPSDLHQQRWQELESNFLLYRESGDAKTTDSLFQELSAILSAYFNAKTKNPTDSEELTQNTLLKIHMHRLSFNKDLPLRTWIFTIAARTLTDHWRSRGRQTDRIDSEAEIERIGNPTDTLGLLETRDQCEKLLAHLSPADRELLRVYAVDDLAVTEIADRHGVSEGAMKVKLHRIYKKLRDLKSGSALALLLCAFALELMKPDAASGRISIQLEPKEETV